MIKFKNCPTVTSNISNCQKLIAEFKKLLYFAGNRKLKKMFFRKKYIKYLNFT